MRGNNLKTHYSAKELLAFSLSLLPNTVQGIIYQAKKQQWKTQKRVGRGGGVEYALSSLPQTVQQEILLKTTPQQTAAALQKIEQNRPLATNELWQRWDEASSKAQEQAKSKLGVMMVVANLVESGVNVMSAFEAVCLKENAEKTQSGEKQLTVGSLKNWWYLIKDAPRQDWLPLLLNNTGNRYIAAGFVSTDIAEKVSELSAGKKYSERLLVMSEKRLAHSDSAKHHEIGTALTVGE